VVLLFIHVFTPQEWPWSLIHPGTRAPWELSEKIPASIAALVTVPLTPSRLREYWESPGGRRSLDDVVSCHWRLTCYRVRARFFGEKPFLRAVLLAVLCLLATVLDTCRRIDRRLNTPVDGYSDLPRLSARVVSSRAAFASAGERALPMPERICPITSCVDNCAMMWCM